MLTIKVKTIDSSRVYTSDVVEISRSGQRVFETIVERAKEHGAVCPSTVIEFGTALVDENGKNAEIKDYDFIINESGRNPADSELIGIMLSCSNDKNDDSLCYEFIYSGDSIYVMNETGQTVEVLK